MCGDGHSKSFHQTREKRSRCANGDLLSHDRAHGTLERTPNSRNTQTWPPTHKPAQQRIIAECGGYHFRIGCKIENAPCYDLKMQEVCGIRSHDEELDCIFAVHPPNLNDGSAVWSRNRARVALT